MSRIFAVVILAFVFVRFDSLEEYALAAGIIWLGLVLTSFFLIRTRIEEKTDYLFLVLPNFLVLGLFGVLPAVFSFVTQLFLAVSVAAVYFFYQSFHYEEIPEYVEQAVDLITAILLMTSIWVINFYFPNWPLVSGMTFLIFVLLFWQAYYKIKAERKLTLISALIGSLILVEVASVLLFWPVHFFTAAVINFMVYYFIYMISSFYFAGRLNRKRLLFHGGIVLLVWLLVIISSPWPSS